MRVNLLIRSSATLLNCTACSAKSSKYQNPAVKSTDLVRAVRTCLGIAFLFMD